MHAGRDTAVNLRTHEPEAPVPRHGAGPVCLLEALARWRFWPPVLAVCDENGTMHG